MKKSLLALSMAGVLLAGCHTDMWVQPKIHEPYQASEFHADGAASRPIPEGTVQFGKAKLDDALYKGRVDGTLVNALPSKLNFNNETVDTRKDIKKVLTWGQERFHIYCSHCHGELGDGKGMIAQRGLALKRPPATYHTDRLRKMPLGHFYDVISNGYGVMYSQSGRVPTDDRWAIAAYIRALQLSQHMPQGELTADEMRRLDEETKAQMMQHEAKPEGEAK